MCYDWSIRYMISLLLRFVPLFVAGVAGIMAAHHWFFLTWAFFILAALVQDRLLFPGE